MVEYRQYLRAPYPVDNYHGWCCEWEPRCDQNRPGIGTTATHGIDTGGRVDLFCAKHAKMAWERDKRKPIWRAEKVHA